MGSRIIAVIGARGVANYGGFETFVAELAPRLHDKGYEVFCSSRLETEGEQRGKCNEVNLIHFPVRFPRSRLIGRIFDVFYDWYFTMKCAFWLRCDVVYCLGLGSGLSLPFARLSRSRIVVNVDGLEWTRQKFNFAERIYLRLSFLASCIWSDRIIIDNLRLMDFVPIDYRSKAIHIPYGVDLITCPEWRPEALAVLAEEGRTIDSGGFLLVVARLEPENNIAMIAEAYARCRMTIPLIVVGRFASRRYENLLRRTIGELPKWKSVLMLGSIYDREALGMLRCHCRAYIHGHSVGGTNPSLLEAMASGSTVLAHDNVFNREVCGDHAIYFRTVDDLAMELNRLDLGQVDELSLRSGAIAAVKERYRWDDVATAYDRFFQSF
jgi:rhamnosyltransferase